MTGMADPIPRKGPPAQRFSPPRLAVAASVLASLVWIPQAFLLASAVAGVAMAAAAGQPLPELAMPVGLFLALAALRSLLDTAGVHLAQRAASAAKAALRREIAGVVAGWSPVDSTRPHAGDVATLAADQAEALDAFVVRYQPTRWRVMIVPFATAAVVAAFSWAAALILLVAFPFIPIFMSLIGIQARERSRVQLAEVGSFTGVLLDRLAGLTTIRLFGAEERVAADIAEAGETIRTRTMAVLRLAFLSSAVLELFAAIGVALVAVYVGFTLIGWIDFGTTAGPLTLATGLFVLFLAPDFFQPLRDFAAAYHDKAAADALSDRLGEVVHRRRSAIVGAGGPAVAASAKAPAIALEQVTVELPGAPRPLVEALDLAILPGERVAIMGPSGSGKSTALAVVAGLVAPSAGRVRIAGRELDHQDADDLRGYIAWVGQSPVLMPASLHRNAALAAPDATREEIATALRLASLGPVLDRLPLGLETPIGETGAGLSGGEIRRLAIARAILADRPVVLADEPTADLDADTAAAVRKALVEIARGRTLLVATHDPLLAGLMDRTVRIEAGRIAEEWRP